MSNRWNGSLDKVDRFRWRIPTSYKPGMRVPGGLIYVDEGHLSVCEKIKLLNRWRTWHIFLE